MSRIASRFQQLAAAQRKALVTFVTAGDPNPGFTPGLMHELVRAGASIIELGVPFSDPMADGPVIQLGNERALQHGVSLTDVLDMVREFRISDADTPVVLMGYLNPIEALGYTELAQRASEAGVDGFIVVDAPPEEAQELHVALQHYDLDLIFLLAPNSDEGRIRKICALASGFIYYVSLKGVTGSGRLDTDAVAQKVAQIKSLTPLPVGVGFGISDAQAAHKIAAISDAVVVGSALVRKVQATPTDEPAILKGMHELVAQMREAMDRRD